MSNRLSEMLELCLQALEDGATVDECLARYPSMSEELRPLLEAAQAARRLSLPEVPPHVVNRGRARVLKHAARLRSSSKPRPRYVTWRLVAIPLMLLAILLITGNALVAASARALPGDSLYPFKRTVEELRLRFASDPHSQMEIQEELSLRRLQETEELLAEKRVENVEFQGRVSQQTPDGWLVAGISVRLTPQTEIEGTIAVGAYVEVRGQTQPDGRVLAERIRVEGDDGGENVSVPPTVTPEDHKFESTPEATKTKATPEATRTDDHSSGSDGGNEEQQKQEDSDNGDGSDSGSDDSTPEPTDSEDNDG